jgi:hypothetical protein
VVNKPTWRPQGQCTYFEIGNDGHARAIVVEGLEQAVVGSACHCLETASKLPHQVKCLISEVADDVFREASAIEQGRHRLEADLLFVELVHITEADQGLIVREGDC